MDSFSVMTDANNVRILDAIRNDMSTDYRNRIPKATDAGVDNVMRKLTEFRPQFNEFENALVNRIGLVIGRAKSWENPLREFKKGLLDFGATIEEYQVGLVKAHNYNPDHDYMEKSLFGREIPDVQANFHTLNRQDFYKITVNEPLLKRAFTSEFGLSEFVSSLMNSPITSDNWDEFMLMCKLFREYDSFGGFHRVQIPAVSDPASTVDDARMALRTLRSVAENMAFISTHYNAAKMPTFAAPDELILFTTPEFRSAIDVNALAGAFNIERADIPHRIITVPREQFIDTDVEAVLTTSDFFIVGDTLMENTSQPNAAGLYTNYFWHHHQIISASRFVPAVAFTTGVGDEVINVRADITGITAINAVDVDGKAATAFAPGHSYELSATVTTEPVGFEDSAAVTWDILGRESVRTRITQAGNVYVSPTETSPSLTVVAYDSNAEDEISAVSFEKAFTVSGETSPEWPVDKGDSETDPGA